MKRFISLILVLFAIFTAAALTQQEMYSKPYTGEMKEHFEVIQPANYFVRLGIVGTDWVVDISPNKKFNGDVYRVVHTELSTRGYVKDLTNIYNNFKTNYSLENVISGLESQTISDPKSVKKFEGPVLWCKTLHVYTFSYTTF